MGTKSLSLNLIHVLRVTGIRDCSQSVRCPRVVAGCMVKGYGTLPYCDEDPPIINKRTRYRQTQPKVPGVPEILGEILYGVHPVKLALQAKRRQLYKLYVKKNTHTEGVKEIKQLCQREGVKIIELQKSHLNRLSEDRPHQGVCLDASKLELDYLSLDENNIRDNMTKKRNKPSLWLLPYTVKDPMNMGNILRSSYFFGVDCVVMPRHESSPLTPYVSKASSGVAEVMNLQVIGSEKTALNFVKLWTSNGGLVIGTACNVCDPKARTLEEVDVSKPILLIIGNEAQGLPDEILQLCDINVYIRPHASAPGLDSLNVSTATGVILHSLTQSREKAGYYPQR